MTRYIKGDPEANYGRDEGRWARCNHCGFINSLESTPHGGDGDGYVVEDTYADYRGDPFAFGDYSSLDLTLWGTGEIGALYLFDPTGEPLPLEYIAHQQTSTSGCRFCGKKNWSD
jgi:hypothetical protein